MKAFLFFLFIIMFCGAFALFLYSVIHALFLTAIWGGSYVLINIIFVYCIITKEDE